MSAALHDIKNWVPAAALKQPQPALQARAAVLWPDSPFNQAAWLRAVALVRRTTGGWLLDQPAPKGDRHA